MFKTVNKNGFAPVIIIVILAILSVIGYSTYKNYVVKQSALVVSSTLPFISTNSNLDTSDWISFTRRDLTLKYPPFWVGIGESGNVVTVGPNDNTNFSLNLGYQPQQKDLDTLVSDAQKPENNGSPNIINNDWKSEILDKSFDGQQGAIVTSTLNGNLFSVLAIVNYKNITYYISNNSPEIKYDNQFLQILDTITFKK